MLPVHEQIRILLVLGVLQSVNVQYAMPMYALPPPPPPPMPIYAMPPPPPVGIPFPYPVPVPVPVTQKPTTTSTTTAVLKPGEGGPYNGGPSGQIAVPMPFPVPMPLPYALPQAPPPQFCQERPSRHGCPPCPPCVCRPSCTPKFYSYCSPCHQQCRCRGDTPRPLPPAPPALPPPPPPMPMPIFPIGPAGPPIVVVPFPPPPMLPPRLPPNKWRDNCESSEKDSDSCSDDAKKKKKKYRKNRRQRLSQIRHRGRFRRRFLSSDTEDNEDDLIKPMLAYMSNDGDVKYQKRITDHEAAKLLNKHEISSDEQDMRRRQNLFEENADSSEESKEFMFIPPNNKKISNVSLSFHLN